MKIVKILLALVFAYYALLTAYSLGAKNSDYAQKYRTEHLLSTNLEKMLKDYYHNKDYEALNDEGEPTRLHTFWEDAIMETEAFEVVDSIKQGNWDSFYKY